MYEAFDIVQIRFKDNTRIVKIIHASDSTILGGIYDKILECKYNTISFDKNRIIGLAPNGLYKGIFSSTFSGDISINLCKINNGRVIKVYNNKWVDYKQSNLIIRAIIDDKVKVNINFSNKHVVLEESIFEEAVL